MVYPLGQGAEPVRTRGEGVNFIADIFYGRLLILHFGFFCLVHISIY